MSNQDHEAAASQPLDAYSNLANLLDDVDAPYSTEANVTVNPAYEAARIQLAKLGKILAEQPIHTGYAPSFSYDRRLPLSRIEQQCEHAVLQVMALPDLSLQGGHKIDYTCIFLTGLSFEQWKRVKELLLEDGVLYDRTTRGEAAETSYALDMDVLVEKSDLPYLAHRIVLQADGTSSVRNTKPIRQTWPDIKKAAEDRRYGRRDQQPAPEFLQELAIDVTLSPDRRKALIDMLGMGRISYRQAQTMAAAWSHQAPLTKTEFVQMLYRKYPSDDPVTLTTLPVAVRKLKQQDLLDANNQLTQDGKDMLALIVKESGFITPGHRKFSLKRGSYSETLELIAFHAGTNLTWYGHEAGVTMSEELLDRLKIESRSLRRVLARLDYLGYIKRSYTNASLSSITLLPPAIDYLETLSEDAGYAPRVAKKIC